MRKVTGIEEKKKGGGTHMWLQPPFFSMEVLHLGHSCVCVFSQLYVSARKSVSAAAEETEQMCKIPFREMDL